MPTNLYGPGDNYHPSDSHVLPALIRRFHEAKQNAALSVSCWGSGKPLREFLHADDLGEACRFALEHWSALDQHAPKDDEGIPLAFLNVGTGIDLSIKTSRKSGSHRGLHRLNSLGPEQTRWHSKEATRRKSPL